MRIASILIMFQSVLAFLKTPTSSRRNAASSLKAHEKRVAFIRHGCTYMNEYLSFHNFGCPNFTDVFSSSDIEKYRDSKLSPRGEQQAKELRTRLERKNDSFASVIPQLDLIVLSPLTRAIQTFELGMQPVFSPEAPPIMALPLASERVYLISDVGRPRSQLQKDYDYIDFDTAFRSEDGDTLIEDWWFSFDDQRQDSSAVRTGITTENYDEWRPSSQNQKYACPGEPDEVFERRMRQLYRWLGDRPESTIAVVCHWGVIDWMLNKDFNNCEVQLIPFSEIKPQSIVKDKAGTF